MIAALRLVYSQRTYGLAAALLFPLVFLFYAWQSQVLVVGQQGVSILIEPSIIAMAGLLAVLFAISLPVQAYAVRLARLGARQTGNTILGLLVGSVSMSCCAPVLLPAILSLAGLSGVTILSVNVAVHRYFVPLALLGALLLLYSLWSTTSSLARTCVINKPD